MTAEVTSYTELIGGIAARLGELGIRYEDFDDLAGFAPGGHSTHEPCFQAYVAAWQRGPKQKNDQGGAQGVGTARGQRAMVPTPQAG
jgi:hypothetical protein